MEDVGNNGSSMILAYIRCRLQNKSIYKSIQRRFDERLVLGDFLYHPVSIGPVGGYHVQ